MEDSSGDISIPCRTAMKLSSLYVVSSFRAAMREVFATSSGTPASLALCSYSQAKSLADMASYLALWSPTFKLKDDRWRWSRRCSRRGFQLRSPRYPSTSAVPKAPAYSKIVYSSLSIVRRIMALSEAGPNCSGVS